MIICLARDEFPDLSAYDDPEIVWRLEKPYHAGLLIASSDAQRIDSLLDHSAVSTILVVAPAVGMGLLLPRAGAVVKRRIPILSDRSINHLTNYELAYLPITLARFTPALWHRPPPALR